MDEVYEYLKAAKAYYLCTVDEDGNPQVRPFGTITKYNGALIIQTGRVKDCFKQMKAHPRGAICAMNPEAPGTWIRVMADFVEDPSVEAAQAALDDYPELGGMYAADDGNCTVLRLENAIAYIDSFTEPRKTFEF